MNNKKLLFLLLIISCLCFFSCKKDKEDINYNEPMTLSFYSADLSEKLPFTDEVAKIITKNTNVILDCVPVKGEASDEISLMIANDSYPDLIFAKGDLIKLIEADAVIPLDDFINQYGYNIKKLYGKEIVKLRNTIDDPRIYTVGTYEIKSNVMETSGNFQIQNAVLKEFGYPVIKTLEDVENILLAYKKRYPEINGHKTLGISLLTDSWYWYVGLSNPGNYVIGYPDDGQWIVNQETMEATYKFLNPEMYRFYKWLNKMYNIGLLDPESFTQDMALWISKLEEGNVLGTSVPHWSLIDIQANLSKNGNGNRTYAYLSVVADKEKFIDPSLTSYGFSGGWGIAITKDCKDPETAFKFLDWMCSEEAQILTNWGIENIHYYYDSQGNRRTSPNYDPNSGVDKWTYPFPQGGAGYLDSTGNPLTKINKEAVISKYSFEEKETLKAYGVEMWIDLFPKSQDLNVPKHGQVWQYSLTTKLSNKVSLVDDYVKNALIKMIIGPQKDFDNNWNVMCNQIRAMGIDEVEKEITRLIQSKMALWEN